MGQQQVQRQIAGRFSYDGRPGERVVLAHDEQLGRDVELRRLSTARDGEAARKLTGVPPHPNAAVARHDVVDDDGTRYLVVDAITGAPLPAAIADAPTPVEVRRWYAQLSGALDHLHAHGVAHGAVSAKNVVIAAGGEAMLVGALGFGSPRRDARRLRRIGAQLVAATQLSPRERRGLHRQLKLRSSRRPLLAASLAAMATAVFSIPADAPTSALPARPHGRSSPRTVTVAPAASSIEPDAVLPSVAPVTASAVADRVLAPLRPARPIGPDRIGVYTPSADFGQFDIYRLDGNTPSFQRRNTGLVMFWSHVATLDDGWLFFYRNADGAQGTSPIEPSGELAYGDASVRGDPGWTSVTSVGDDVVWFYRRDTGAAWAIRYVDGFHVGNTRYDTLVGRGFDQAVGIGRRHVLHYQAASGQGRLVALTDGGQVAAVSDVTLPSGWTALAGTLSGRLVGVTATGQLTVMKMTDGALGVERTAQLGAVGWSQATGLRDGAVITSLTGGARVVQFGGGELRATTWQVPPGALVVAVR